MQFLVSLVTPFDAGGRVDLGRLRAHVLWLAAHGVDGFVVTAAEGEFLYLSEREREAIHNTVLDARGDKAVYPCVWDPSPRTVRALAESARDRGAAGVMLPPPLFYDLTEDMVMGWYEGIGPELGIPVFACLDRQYIRTPMTPKAYALLRARGVLGGIRDGSQDPWRIRRLAASDPGALIVAGDRMLYLVREMEGVKGFISSLANAWPQMLLRIFHGGDVALEHALMRRAYDVETVGGFRALKALLRMGGRAPLSLPSRDLLAALPPSEFDL